MQLAKSLYVLKQSTWVFNQLLMSKLLSLGLVSCKSDPCVFRLMSLDGRVRFIVGVYDDDFIVIGGEVKY